MATFKLKVFDTFFASCEETLSRCRGRRGARSARFQITLTCPEPSNACAAFNLCEVLESLSDLQNVLTEPLSCRHHGVFPTHSGFTSWCMSGGVSALLACRQQAPPVHHGTDARKEWGFRSAVARPLKLKPFQSSRLLAHSFFSVQPGTVQHSLGNAGGCDTILISKCHRPCRCMSTLCNISWLSFSFATFLGVQRDGEDKAVPLE